MTKHSILIVDDEADLRELLLESLDRQGYSAEAVASGEEALARMAKQSFSVVITDLHMPGGLTGLDLIEAIRSRFPDTLCILITAFATLDTSIEALKRGAYDFIPKPFRLSDMEVVLNRALEHASVLRQLRDYQWELETRIMSRTRNLQESHQEALALCDLSLQALEAPNLAAALEPFLDRLSVRWLPDGMACYRKGEDGLLTLIAVRSDRPLPPRLERPNSAAQLNPGLGYAEEHLLPLGNAGWLYLGFADRSSFQDTDPGFLLLSRHLELALRGR